MSCCTSWPVTTTAQPSRAIARNAAASTSASVYPRERLICEQATRRADPGRGDLGSTPLPARKLKRCPIYQVADGEPFQDLCGPRLTETPLNGPNLLSEREPSGEEIPVGKKEQTPSCKRGKPRPQVASSIEVDHPVVRAQQSSRDLEEGALSTAVASEQGRDPAPSGPNRGRLQDRPGPEGLADRIGREHRRRGHLRAPRPASGGLDPAGKPRVETRPRTNQARRPGSQAKAVRERVCDPTTQGGP